MGGHPIDPQILLRESAWVHALARSLVGDASTADDVVQETWLAALERPPRAREPGQVRAFLATVVRRVAGSVARDAASRRRRERSASRAEAVAPESDALERLAVQRQLANALLELREPYRSAVVLRYVEGLAPREIAVRLDVSPEAVRTRISRGLEQLREQLDREHGGDRGAWAAVLGGMTHIGPEAPAIAGVFAGGIMGLKAVLVAAAALVTTALLWTWSSRADDVEPGESALVAQAPPDDPGADHGSSGLALPASAVDPERAPAAGTAASAPAARGRVVSAFDRRPLAGARIGLPLDDVVSPAPRAEIGRELEAALQSGDSARAEQLRQSLDEPAFEHTTDRDLREILAACGADGRFELAALPEDARVLVATAEGHVSGLVDVEALRGASDHEIALAPAGQLEVDVVDGAGKGRANLAVTVGPAGETTGVRPLLHEPLDGHGPSNAAGRITVEGLPCGVDLTVALASRSGSTARAAPQRVRIDANSRTAHVTLRVEDSGALRGAVRPAAVADAKLQARFAPSASNVKPFLTADVAPDGTFAFERVPIGRGILHLVTVRTSDRASSSLTEPLSAEIVGGETTDVGVIELRPTVRLAGHVLDWRGANSGYFVGLRCVRDGTVLAHTTLDDDGRFETWLAPGDCVIELVNHGRVMAALPAHAPDDDFEIDLLAWCAALSGRVPASGGRDTRMLFPVLTRSELAISSQPQHGPFQVTDGAFRALPLEPGSYSLLVPFGTRGAAWIPRVELVRGRDTDVGELVPGFGSVRGRVVASDGRSVASVAVTLSSPFRAALASHAPLEAVTGEHGAFAFDRVPAGAWQVNLSETDGAVGRTPLVDVFPNARTDVDVALAAAARLTVRVTHRGEPQVGTPVDLTHVDGPGLPFSGATDDAGRIEAASLLPGTWRWSVGGAVRTGTIVLNAGEQRALGVDVGVGGVTCRVVAGTGDEPWISEATAWSLEPATAGQMRRARADRGARFDLDVAPGRWLIVMQVRDPEGGALPVARQRTAIVDVPHGAIALEVALSDVALELGRSGTAVHASPPRAALVALAGLSTESWGITFPSDSVGSAVRFASLPPGATLRLRGTLPPGDPVERVVVVDAAGTVRLEWR